MQHEHRYGKAEEGRQSCDCRPFQIVKKPMRAIGIAETGDMCVGFCPRQIPLLRDLSGEC